MLYKHLDKSLAEEDRYIVDEEGLRKDLYDQALDDLEYNKSEYFEGKLASELSKMLDVLKIAIYGSVENVIKTYEQIWEDIIIKVEEDN